MKRLVIAALLAASPMAFAGGTATTLVANSVQTNVKLSGIQMGTTAMIGLGSTITIPGVGSVSSANILVATQAAVVGKGSISVTQGGTISSSASGN